MRENIDKAVVWTVRNSECYVFIKKMSLRIDSKFYNWMSNQLGWGLKNNIITLEVSNIT